MFKVLFLFTLLVTALGAPATGDDDEEGWRIVGGSDAGATEAPFQVSLRSTSNLHFCGGSLITARTVVTAASCVIETPASSMMVVVGTNSLNYGGTRYPVFRITIHKDYNANTDTNDVAVVVTSTPIVGIANVAPIPLSTSTVGAGVALKLTGWGTTSYHGVLSSDLQTITLNSLSVNYCQAVMSGLGNVSSSQICTLTMVGEGACHGDTGGPLVGDGQLVGIMSWGYHCAAGYPDVFTRVSFFAGWIKENLQK